MEYVSMRKDLTSGTGAILYHHHDCNNDSKAEKVDLASY